MGRSLVLGVSGSIIKQVETTEHSQFVFQSPGIVRSSGRELPTYLETCQPGLHQANQNTLDPIFGTGRSERPRPREYGEMYDPRSGASQDKNGGIGGKLDQHSEEDLIRVDIAIRHAKCQRRQIHPIHQPTLLISREQGVLTDIGGE